MRLLRAARAAIRAADRRAKIVFGGLSTNDLDYVRAAYAAGAKGQFDVMALHPYSCEARIDDPKRDASGALRSNSFLGYRAVRDFMVARGDAKPMWFTELGWSTTGEACGVSEAEQAERLETSVALMARDPYVRAAMFYNLRNNYWLARRRHDRGALRTAHHRLPPQARVLRVPGHGPPFARAARRAARAARLARRA